MEVTINLSREDLTKLENFRLLFVKDAKKKGDQYQLDLWTNASIETLTAYYLTSKLQNW